MDESARLPTPPQGLADLFQLLCCISATVVSVDGAFFHHKNDGLGYFDVVLRANGQIRFLLNQWRKFRFCSYCVSQIHVDEIVRA
jgi:hypothetical protein